MMSGNASKLLLACCVVAMGVCVGACGSALKREAPVIRSFDLECRATEIAVTKEPVGVARMGSVYVAAPYNDRRLHHLVGEAEVRQDLSAQFVALPQVLLRRCFRESFAESGVFEGVIPLQSTMMADYEIQVSIERFAIDHRGAQPTATLNMEVLVVSMRGDDSPSIVHRHQAVISEAVNGTGAEAEVLALNAAINKAATDTVRTWATTSKGWVIEEPEMTRPEE